MSSSQTRSAHFHNRDQPSPSPVPVIACVVRRDGRYLICRRPTEKRHGGLWEFPGGKILPGESLDEAAERELQEELSLQARRSWRQTAEVEDPGSPFIIRFAEGRANGEPLRLEHSALDWVKPAHLLSFRLAPADFQFAQSLASDSDGVATSKGAAFHLVHAEISRCLHVWDLSDADFNPGIRTIFSSRMSRSLGRTYPARSRVHLSARLAEPGAEDLLAEVVCHELAHLAAYVATDHRPKPHGREWRALLTAVGHQPRLSIPVDLPNSGPKTVKPAPHYDHRCEVCHRSWSYSTPRRQLRCPTCQDAGLSGHLIIHSVAR